MKKIIILLLVGLVLSSCATSKASKLNSDEVKSKFAATILKSDLETRLYILASDVLEGRQTGEKGQKLAGNYIADFYSHLELSSPVGVENYLQEIQQP